jgi:hypothetical protein
MLALAASYGVYSFALLFVPFWVAVVQASAFELTYVGLAVLVLPDASQLRRARSISYGAVVVSIAYNSLAGLFHRQPDILAGLPLWAEWTLAVLHGAPLAWVAFLVSDLLLHRAPADAPATRADKAATPKTEDVSPADALCDEIAANSAPVNIAPVPETPPARDYRCRHCGAEGLTLPEMLAHGRNKQRTGACGRPAASAD